MVSHLRETPGLITGDVGEESMRRKIDMTLEQRVEGLAVLFPEVYKKLRSLASRALANERPGHSWQPTDIVHEAFLRLSRQAPEPWTDRQRFLSDASRSIRRILIDHARERLRLRRGGDRQRLSLSELAAPAADTLVDLLDLDAALERLALRSQRKARLVELRFFGGFTMEECARELAVSLRVAADDWAVARAWLERDLGRSPAAPS